MKNRIFASLVALSGMLLFLSSCYKDPLKDLTEDESRIYITNYDTSVTFSSYRTYSIADSVAIISNNNFQSDLGDHLYLFTNDIRKQLFTNLEVILQQLLPIQSS